MENKQSKVPLVRKSALNHGHWKPNEQLRVRFAEQVSVSEYEKEEGKNEVNKTQLEQERQIVENLFQAIEGSNEEKSNANWGLLSKVGEVSSRFAAMARNALGHEEFYDSSDIIDSDGSRCAAIDLQPCPISFENLKSNTSDEAETFLTRCNTLEDDKYSHGRVFSYTKPLNNGNQSNYRFVLY